MQQRRRAVYVGRFQPPHCGHGFVIKWALERFDELIVVIGSAQESHTLRNPFTAGERFEMLLAALRDWGVDGSRIFIIPVQDIGMNYVWVRYLEMQLPRFEAAVARNPLVVRLFREAGYPVLQPPAYRRSECSATRIRELMLHGDDSWRRLVPPSVARLIEEFRGVERIRELAGSD